MKQLLALLLFVPSLCFAQSVTLPYNPDANADNAIGAPDLLEMLPLFGGYFTPEPILVDGQTLEQYIENLESALAESESDTVALPMLPGTEAGQMLYWDGNQWTLVPAGTNGEFLGFVNQTPAWLSISIEEGGLRLGCLDESACNFDELATVDYPSTCLYDDICGICDGPGAIYECGCADMPEDDCDCDGNQLDALNVCGGTCTADVDGDGICDDGDDCIGEADECGVCNGPGAIYECGCSGVPAQYCDCQGALDIDNDGICDDVDECIGTTDAIGDCNGTCETDADGDGICDDNGGDPCDGDLDICGVCNGPGPIFECGCFDLPAEACDCTGSLPDVNGNCLDCLEDIDGDGIYDVTCGPCLGQTTLTYFGEDYELLELDGRCWFKQNLNTSQYQNGTEIADFENSSYQEGFYVIYGQDSIYGRLYNGYAATQNVCPQYWEVPSAEEWQSLSTALGGNEVSGGSLKEAGLAHWQSPNAGATNSSGFSALPSGELTYYPAELQNLTVSAIFWSKPSYVPEADVTSSTAIAPSLNTFSPSIEFPAHSINRAHSIRCLRQLPVLGCTQEGFIEYSPSANIDDGSCSIPAVLGCTDDRFNEFDPSANSDDGSCTELLGCQEGSFLTYHAKNYDIATIGDQCWFLENLDASYYQNGEAIQNLQSSIEWGSTSYGEVGAWCYLYNDSTHVHSHGKLYNGWAVLDPRGLCPVGWHVPSIEDFDTLMALYGGYAYAADALKASNLDDPPWNGSNSSGFTALPGGQRLSNYVNFDWDNEGFFQTSTTAGQSGLYAKRIYYYGSGVFSDGEWGNVGRSVRCIRD